MRVAAKGRHSEMPAIGITRQRNRAGKASLTNLTSRLPTMQELYRKRNLSGDTLMDAEVTICGS